MSADALCRELKVPLDFAQKQRKRLEETCLIIDYSVDPTKFGLRRIDLLIHTDGRKTMNIRKDLLKREDVSSVVRMIGEHTIDLRIEVFVKDNRMLLNIIEEIKTIPGVRDVVWTEVVETIGMKNANHFVI